MMGISINRMAAALLPATALAQVFPAPPGDFRVHLAHTELIDESRLDPFNDTHVRRIMVSQFTPVPNHECVRTCKVPYMSAELSKFEDDIFYEYYGDIGWPGQVLDKLELETCCEVKKGSHKVTYPTVFLDTGLNTTRLFYTGTAQHIASLGYEVILLDHPYETDVVQFPDGEIIFGGHIGRDPNNTAVLQFGLDVRADDASFVLDTLKICRAVYIGHSFGGAAAANVIPKEPRIVGGVNLDGALWGRAINAGVAHPFLQFGSAGHNSSSEPSWSSFWDAMDSNYPDVWYRELTLDDALHGSYWDLPIIGDITGLREEPTLEEFLFGKVTGERVMEVLRAYLGDFVNFSLLGGDEGLLAEESPEFPDVHFLR
jgi:pimeloyl-ACP methyl ester carboxylesterase